MLADSLDVSAAPVTVPERPALRPPLTGRLAHEVELRRARRIARLELVFQIGALAILALAMGASQAMRTRWFEQVLLALGPVAFLVGGRVARRVATLDFPSGYQRALALGLLYRTLAMIAVGSLLLADAVVALVHHRAPPIGDVVIAGTAIWRGWAMIAALVVAAVPPLALARRKRRLAGELQDKGLDADARAGATTWITAAIAAAGIAGARAGVSWADAVAGLAIALDIVRRGWRQIDPAAAALLDRLPRGVDGAGVDPAVATVLRELAATPWARVWQLRLREHGPQLAGEIVVEVAPELAAAEVAALAERLHRADWRLEPVVVVPTRRLPVAARHDLSLPTAPSSPSAR